MSKVSYIPVLCAGPVAYYAHLWQHQQASAFDTQEVFVKQTYRNRYRIAGANGPITLTVPVTKPMGKTMLPEIEITNVEPWQDNHWKSLVSAYQSSPFFEYYDYLFQPLFTKQFTHLLDFQMAMHGIICHCLTTEYPIRKSPDIVPFLRNDLRHFYQAKNPSFVDYQFPEYQQVFSYQQPFIPNLSVLDVLFNLGPEATMYLENVKIP